MHRKQQWKIIAGISISLLLLISGIIVYHYTLSQKRQSSVVDESLSLLRKEKGGENAYSVLKKIVFLSEDLQPVSLLEDISLSGAQEGKTEDTFLLTTLLAKHEFITYDENKKYVSLNPKHVGEIRRHHANFTEALPAIIAALGTKNHLIAYDGLKLVGATSSVVLENELRLLEHVKNHNQLATSEGLRLLGYLIYTNIFLDHLAEALNYAAKAAQMANKLYPKDHKDKLNVLIGVGFAMARHSTPQAAYYYYQEALDMLQRLYPDPSPRAIAVNKQMATILANMRSILHRLGKTKEAKKKMKQAMKIAEISQIMQPLSAYSDFWAYFWYNWAIFKKKWILLGRVFIMNLVVFTVGSQVFLLWEWFRNDPDFQNLTTSQFVITAFEGRLIGIYKKFLFLFNATEIGRKSYNWVWTFITFLPYYLFDKIFAWHFEPTSQAPLYFAWVKIWVFFGVFFTLFLLYNCYPWQYHYRGKDGKKRTIGKSMLISCVEIWCAVLVSACVVVIFCTLLLALAILKSKRANRWTSLNKKRTLPAILQPNEDTDKSCIVCFGADQERWNPCLQCATGESKDKVMCFSCFTKVQPKPTVPLAIQCPNCRSTVERDYGDMHQNGAASLTWNSSRTYRKRLQSLSSTENEDESPNVGTWQHLRLLLDSFFFDLQGEVAQRQEAPIDQSMAPQHGGMIVQPPQQGIQQPALDTQIAQQQQARHQAGVADVTLLLTAMKFFFIGFVPIMALISWVSPATLAYLIDFI